ncbi:MAG: DHH family phosphoesterase [Nanobdellota archaeon]
MTQQTIPISTFQELYDVPDNTGKTYTITAKIERLFRRNDGLNLFTVFDGQSRFKLVKFIPKTVAFPQITDGSYARITFTTKYYEGHLEGVVQDMQLLSSEEKNSFMKKMDDFAMQKYQPESITFEFQNTPLGKLRPRMERTIFHIRKAIFEKRPILLTHHADCDGYSAGYIFEDAITKLIKKVHPNDKYALNLINRIPSRTPYYDLSDATKDIAFFKTSQSRNSSPNPLILIVDNGSTAQDILSIKKVKLFGADVITIDHHDPGRLDEQGKSVICKEVLEHVNPHLESLSKEYSASLLAYAMAPFISSEKANAFPAVVGALADRSDVVELHSLIEKTGESREYLKSVAKYVDFEIFLTRTNVSESALKELLFGPKQQRDALLSLYDEEFAQQQQEVISSVKNFSTKEVWGDYGVVLLNGEKTSFRGDYYSIGKLAGIAHDNVHDKDLKNAMTIIFSDSIIVFRVKQTKDLFDVNAVISYLKEQFPHARISGGGHSVAGSVKFLPVVFDDLMVTLKDYVSSLNNK